MNTTVDEAGYFVFCFFDFRHSVLHHHLSRFAGEKSTTFALLVTSMRLLTADLGTLSDLAAAHGLL